MAKNKQKTDTTKPATPDSPKPVKVTAPIPALSLVESETMEDELPLNLIDPDPENIRGSLRPQAVIGRPTGADGNPEGGSVEALAESILANGLRTRIIVRPVGDRFVVVDGHRRFAALKSLEAAGKIPADYSVRADVVSYPDPAAIHAEMLVQAFAREDLSPSDKARAVYTACERHKLSDAALARAMAHSPAYIGGLRRIGSLATRGENGTAALELWDAQRRGVTYDVLKDKVCKLDDMQLAEWINAIKKGETYKFPTENKPAQEGSGEGGEGDGEPAEPKRADMQALPKLGKTDKAIVDALSDETLGLGKDVIGWATVILAHKAACLAAGKNKPLDVEAGMRAVSPRKAEKLYGKINAEADK